MNYGFTHRVYSRDNTLPRPPKFYDKKHVDPESQFCSVYAVRPDDAKWIEEAGTVTGFKGLVWSQRLWLDFDDLSAAESAMVTLHKMGVDYVVYDTGGRGYHIGILRDAVPSHLLPQQDKLWVSTNLPNADLSIYWHLHLFRLPGAVHSKTGRRKAFVRKTPGKALHLPKWNGGPTETVQSTGLSQSKEDRPSVFSTWSVISNLQPTGHRRQLVELASAIKADTKITFDEALWLVLEVNRGFNSPRGVDEVEKIVKWAYENK